MRTLTVIISTLFLAVSLQAQITLEDVTIPATLKAGETTVTLNGAGVRKKLFFKLYVGGLFLTSKSSNGNAIAKADEPMAVRLHIISSMINKDNMTEAIIEGFENSTGDNTAPIQDRIDQLMVAFNKEIVVGDIFDLTYVPGTGVTLTKNGKALTTVTGLDFKQALFGIWLGDKPADSGLKEGMLGLK